MQELFDIIIKCLAVSDEFHNPDCAEYQALTVFADRYRKIYEKDVAINLFGQSVFIPNIIMGKISTADLFVIHEFVLFQKYLSLKNKYKNFFDIGANIGIHSLVARNLGFSVSAFEPDPETFEILKRIVQENSRGIEIRNSAVSSDGGVQKFIRVEDNLTASGLINSTKSFYGPTSILEVDVVGVNDLDLSDSIVKIDAEGSEYNILREINFEKISNSMFFIEVSNKESKLKLWELFNNNKKVKLTSQKNAWKDIDNINQIPENWREGSLAIEV